VYTETYNGIPYGAVIGISVFGDSSDCKIIVSFNSGKGMSSMKGGVAIYSFDGKLTEVYKNDTDFGLVANYFNPLESDGFTGVYFVSSRGLFKIDTDGKWELLNDSIGPIKAGMTLVNGEYLYGTYYKTGKSVVVLDLNGNIVKEFGEQPESIANYCMTSAIVIGNWIYTGTDRGAYSVYGELPEISPASHETPWYSVLLMLIGAIVAIFAGLYAVMRFGMKIEHPFSRISEKYQNYFHGEKLSHGSRNRHRLYLMLLIGFAGTAVTFVICLCLGPTDIMSVPEMLGNLFSAIGKGGNNLTFEELAVYNSRLPRTLAAMFVGIGLSIAGCMYQAIIRNPLVDPYIMGVSAGAGTAAIAVIAFDFTFFGLFSQNSIFLTAISAMVGGVIAFFATMLLAEKAGGNSINYVLAGVVVGLAFSAIQTMMISMAGERISDSMSWLFGSFSNISWTQIGMIVIPTAVMSLIPLIWAKEFNLVLLGEDQAKQMGLDVRRFNRLMLILASVLTSICVAFVGIIGFVGLVVPHLCRMLLGGDHRLVMPASIAVGGLMMMLADLASRMLMHGQELPVGAITTLIGVPVFAYLLIRRGKMYDG
jgi:ABC-type Fe3+-siderophore transport system permease subunit